MTITICLLQQRPRPPPVALRSIAATGATTTHADTVARFEVMDGCPVRGETIPIRLPLAGLPTVPTAIGKSLPFSVQWLLNLVLIDEEDRRYFKQTEVTLFRAATAVARPTGKASKEAPSADV